MQRGFIQIPNDFFESDYWRQSRTYNDCEAVLDIMSQVRFEASEHIARIGGREVKWGQNQWPASVRFLATRWKWTEWKVRTFLSKLKRDGIIETSDDQGVNMITLKKYTVHTANNTPSHTDNNLDISDLVNKLTQQITHNVTQELQNSHNTHTKHNNGEEEIIPPLSPKVENCYDWSVLPDDFIPIVKEWIDFKKEKKQTYKPKGFKALCKRLLEDTGGDAKKARVFVDYSMANNYSGIFGPKEYESKKTPLGFTLHDNSTTKYDNDKTERW